jgi:hypothetical protein
MSYTNHMSNDVAFSLDPAGGQEILVSLAMATIKERGQAITARAQSMASSISSDPPEISMTTAPGTIKRGVRAIATIRAVGKNAHQNYIGHMVLAKAKDAGRT